MNGVIDLLNYSRLFTPFKENIQGQEHIIISPNYDEFLEKYSEV